jgi:beta-glucosidase-like glycosyl hydrolase
MPPDSAETTDPSTTFSRCVERLRAGQALDGVVDDLLGGLSQDERLGLLDGDLPFWDGLIEMNVAGYNRTPIPMGRVERLGIPGLLFSDGPRGVVMGHSTAFPVSMARGATWDRDLEERVGTAIGLEGRAQGANFFGGVCINLPRHPAWGRVQETYGEDPLLLGEMGAALVRGVHPNMMAVAKHYALNSMENARFTVDVSADGATLHEVFLAHFRRVVDEGVDGIMTSYNSVNGEWAGENEGLLEGVLRQRWGFEGVTVSDFLWGLRDAAKSLRAGLDVEEPFAQQRAQHLPEAIRSGAVTDDHIGRAARRILGTQLRYYARRDDAEPAPSVVFSDAHRALAREVAGRAMVLLKNEPVDGEPLLPLDRAVLSRVAVIGRLAGVANTGDHGSSDVRSPAVVTPLEGIRAALPGVEVSHTPEDDPALAADAALTADLAVVLVGYTAEDEGEYIDNEAFGDPELLAVFPPFPDDPALQKRLEGLLTGEGGSTVGSDGAGGDRLSLRLRPVDADIIRAVAAANARTVVAIITAGAVITEEWSDAVPAVLLSWYSGSEGGHALADVLLGAVDASGRLPFSVPVSEDHLPFFERTTTAITYDKWFGQRLLDRDGLAAAFPLGFGLSYTKFALSDLSVGDLVGDSFEGSVTVTNTGQRAGRHVVQLYGRLEAGDDFPGRVLLGFGSVVLEPGDTATVELTGSTRPLQRWTDDGFTAAAGSVVVEAAAFAGDPEALTAPVAFRLS